jgi:hypothetical protein
MTSNLAERALGVLFRCIGAAAILALAPVFMPHAWMDACHRSLGLGELPETPVVVYLTRSLSLLYAFHGGMLWIVGGDVRRYRPLALYLAAAFIVMGAVTLWIDLHAGMPWFWTASEGPASIAVGIAAFCLQRKILLNQP